MCSALIYKSNHETLRNVQDTQFNVLQTVHLCSWNDNKIILLLSLYSATYLEFSLSKSNQPVPWSNKIQTYKIRLQLTLWHLFKLIQSFRTLLMLQILDDSPVWDYRCDKDRFIDDVHQDMSPYVVLSRWTLSCRNICIHEFVHIMV